MKISINYFTATKSSTQKADIVNAVDFRPMGNGVDVKQYASINYL